MTSLKGKWAVSLFVLSTLLAVSRPAWALKVLEGQEALQYIGESKPRFTDGSYTYEILKRSHRDAMNGRFSDAVIFNRQGKLFRYIERSDGTHRLVVNDPKGREEDPVTADAVVWNPIANALQDDHPFPTVFLDDAGKEIAVVYIGSKTQLKHKINDQGLLELAINVNAASRGASSPASSRRR